jgi:hypothetical protein
MAFLKPQKAKCKSCIFTHQVVSEDRLNEIMKYLLTGRSHICHNTGDQLRPPLACRGGRDLQLKAFALAGLIAEPTDDALETANEAYLKGRGRSGEFDS